MAKPKKPPANPPPWAKRLAAARLMVADTQTKFAEMIGISQQRYSHYEIGDREPDIAMWVRIRQKVNVSIDFIFVGSESATPKPPK